MRILSGGGGLAWREDSIEVRFYDLLIEQNGSYTIEMHKVVQSAILASGHTSALIGKAGATNSLTVIARGSKMYLYINRNFVTLVQGSSFLAGNVGVVAETENGRAEAVYTNAKF